jgi:hypothetical protein
MRIYTEVNFQWNDKKGKLVEVSSESFDYNGEMALCKAPQWKTYYDAAGNKWSVKGEYSTLSAMANEVSAVRYYKNGKQVHWDKSPEGDNAWSNQVEVFGRWATAHEDFVTAKKGAADTTLFTSLERLDQYWAENYYTERPESTSSAEELVEGKFENPDWAYAGGAWQETAALEDQGWTEDTETGEWSFQYSEEATADLETLGELIAAGDYNEKYDINEDGVLDLSDVTALQQSEMGGDIDPIGVKSTEDAKAVVETQIEGLIKNWEAHLTPDAFDAVEENVDLYISGLKGKEKAVTTAYEDIFGAEGTIFDIEETWETDVERGEEKYTTDIGTAKTTEEEGLEGTVVGREGELEALREEAGTNIRAAEAKIGAAGFASTGVGRTARDVLAKEIGGAARDIDEGFTEERSDVKRTYLDTVDPLKKKFGEGGTAYADYIRDRDLAAKGVLSAWETASTEYTEAERAYREDFLPNLSQPMGGLDVALSGIGSQIASFIGEIRAPSDASLIADPEWDPFEADYLSAQFAGKGYGLETFGIDPSLMMFTGISDEYTGALETEFYKPYEADPLLELYDPEKKLPWENGGGGGGGDPYKPGGQR